MQKRKLENLVKRGKKYYIDFYDKQTKQRVRISTGTDIEDVAKEFRNNYFYNLKYNSQRNNNVGCINNNQEYIFDDIAIKFIEDKQRSCRYNTIKQYKSILKNLTSFFSGKNLKEINKTLIKSYENYRLINGLTQEFLKKELVVLQIILNMAVEYDMLEKSPFINYNFKKELKSYEPKTRFLTPAEARLLISNSNELLAIQLIFLFNTGLRINELLNLLYTDVAVDPITKINYITIRKEISKNKKERIIPLTKQAMEQINKMKIKFPDSLFIFVDNKGQPYKTTPKKAFETAKRKSNLKDIGGFHITRHTAGSWWLQGTNLEGESVKPLRIEIVKELLGHSSVLITEKHYAKLTNQNILLSLNKF